MMAIEGHAEEQPVLHHTRHALDRVSHARRIFNPPEAAIEDEVALIREKRTAVGSAAKLGVRAYIL